MLLGSVSRLCFHIAALPTISSTLEPTLPPYHAFTAKPIGTGLAPASTGFPAVNSGGIFPNATSQNTTKPAWQQGLINSGSHFLKGVNLGGWLVLEKWMTSDGVFDNTTAVDQWTFDQTPNAESKLQQHWATFFTESDITTLKSYGVNALRLPVGFWAWDNAGTPYIMGAAKYLDKAIEWARNANMLVWIDLHGLPGSQNGYDNSGHKGNVTWQQGNNLNRSISVLTTMAKKYGAESYADVIAGIELVNEPISWGNNNFNVTKTWAVQAYHAVRNTATNKNLQIIMHDSFVSASSWFDANAQLNPKSGTGNSTVNGTTSDFYGFALDTHLYQLYNDADNALNQQQHIAKACSYRTDNLQPAVDAGMPIYVGEWTGTTNACINPDGSSVNGTSTKNHCKVAGCQCIVDTPTTSWSNSTRSAVRKFISAQLYSFEAAGSGFFVWSAKGPGTWSFLQGIEEGWFPRLDGDFQHACDGVNGQ